MVSLFMGPASVKTINQQNKAATIKLKSKSKLINDFDDFHNAQSSQGMKARQSKKQANKMCRQI